MKKDKITVRCEEGIDIKLREYPPIELNDGKDPMFWVMVSVVALQITLLALMVSLW